MEGNDPLDSSNRVNEAEGNAHPNRWRVVGTGGAVVAGLGLVLASMSLVSFASDPSLPDIVSFIGAVLLAPFFLVWELMTRQSWPIPWSTMTGAIVAIVATPAHTIAPRSSAAALATGVGLLAWLFCSLIVAGAPA